MYFVLILYGTSFFCFFFTNKAVGLIRSTYIKNDTNRLKCGEKNYTKKSKVKYTLAENNPNPKPYFLIPDSDVHQLPSSSSSSSSFSSSFNLFGGWQRTSCITATNWTGVWLSTVRFSLLYFLGDVATCVLAVASTNEL